MEWPTKGRVRALLAVAITGYGMWKGLISEQLVSAVIFFYFGMKAAANGR